VEGCFSRVRREKGLFLGEFFCFLEEKGSFLRFVFMIPVIDALDCRCGLLV
jgi:hypothetical protein